MPHPLEAMRRVLDTQLGGDPGMGDPGDPGVAARVPWKYASPPNRDR